MSAHRSLRVFAWMCAIVVIALPLFAASNGWLASERWPFRQLKIEGAFQHVSDEVIRAAALPALTRGYFAVDLNEVRDQVQSLAWIERAEVRKHWPDQLEVRVIERHPIAFWGDAQLLGDSGSIFSVPLESIETEMRERLPRFDGPENQRQRMTQFHASALQVLSSTDLVPNRLVLSARGAWVLRLADGAELILGRDQAEERLARFADVYRKLERTSNRRLSRADLRYENGFALRWDALSESVETNPATTPIPSPLAPAAGATESATL